MIERSSAFKKDYKKIKSNAHYGKLLDDALSEVLKILMTNQSLPAKYRDHGLIGDWSSYRECRLKPDLLLIYKKIDRSILQLARLGSHSELFS